MGDDVNDVAMTVRCQDEARPGGGNADNARKTNRIVMGNISRRCVAPVSAPLHFSPLLLLPLVAPLDLSYQHRRCLLLAHFKTVSHTQNTFLLATHNIYKLNASLNNKPSQLDGRR